MRVLTITGLLLAYTAAAFAQTAAGTITGTIADQSGAIVAGAMVQARHVETGTIYDTASTSTGNYTVSQLPVGTYEISASVAGFKKYARAGIIVTVASVVRVDIALEVGNATEAVTVNEAAPLLETESGDVSHNVATVAMDALPILGQGSSIAGSSGIRNPGAVGYIIPGVWVQENSVIRVNGEPGNTYSIRIEGQDITNGNQGGTQAQQQPSIDMIQEVTVQTSNFAAEYGEVGGGYFNYTMKSGTNQLHGSAYDYFVNEILNADTPWVNTKPRARRNDYGFTLGGPVKIPKIYNGHDRTFFFFNWEQYRETEIINNLFLTLPTPAYRAGNYTTALTGRTLGTDPLARPILEGAIYDPSTQRTAPTGQLIRDAFPGNIIPLARMDPVALAIQSLIPLPNLSQTALVNNGLLPFPSTRHTEIPSFKIDHSLNERQKLSFYWHETKTASVLSPQLSGADGLPPPITQAMGTFVTSWVYRLNYDYTVTPTMLFHAGIGYLHNHFDDDPIDKNFNPASIGLTGDPVDRLFPYMTGLCNTSASTGYYASGCAGTGGMKYMGTIQNRAPILYNKPTANVSLTWVRGNHTYKAGGEFKANQNFSTLYTYTGGNFNFSPNETGLPYLQSSNLGGGTVGFAYASFMLGLVDSFRTAPIINTHMGQNAEGFFLQDSWKVTRNLTFDYGLRYDFQTYIKESTASPFAQFAPNVPNPSAGGQPGAVEFEGNGPGRCNCSLAKDYPWAWAPRLGFAYQVLPKTVLRGGFGIVYAQVSDSQTSGGGAAYTVPPVVSSTSFGQPAMVLAQGIPFQPAPFPNSNPGQYPQAGYVTQQAPPFFMDQNAGRPPRITEWSFGVERAISTNLMVQATYVGNIGVWWIAPQFVNPNGISNAILTAHGLSLSNSADLTLLGSPLNSAVAAQRGFNNPPFTGFPLTATVAQSIRPFPQFNTIIGSYNPDGNNKYHALQMKATERLSHGLAFQSFFTWAKQLGTASGSTVNNATTVGLGTGQFNDQYNPNQGYTYSLYDQPFVFGVSPQYTTPKTQWGGNSLAGRMAQWLARDWTIGAVLDYASGLPILSPSAENNLNTDLLRANSGQLSFMNRVPGVPLFLHNLNCHCFDPTNTLVLNPAAWANPAPGQWGSAAPYYGDYRFQRHPNENMNLGRTFRVKERVTFNLRVEFNNVFNRAQMPNPTSTNPLATPTYNSLGQVTGGFGSILTSGIGVTTAIQTPTSRQGQIVGRINF
ncbi:MAG TPA: TonB-dependent receptor [Bryobacteraceae bacterium]